MKRFRKLRKAKRIKLRNKSLKPKYWISKKTIINALIQITIIEGTIDSFLMICTIPIKIIKIISVSMKIPRIIKSVVSGTGGIIDRNRLAKGCLVSSTLPKEVNVKSNHPNRKPAGSVIEIILSGKNIPMRAIIAKIIGAIPRKRVYLLILLMIYHFFIKWLKFNIII